MILYLFLTLLFIIIVLRVILPGMKMESGKTSNGTPPTGTSTAGKRFEWRKSNLMSIPLIVGTIAALFLVFWLWPSLGTSGTSSRTLSVDTVGKFTEDYWLLPLILGGIFLGLESVKKKWTEAVRWTAATLACIMLVAPVMVWVRDISLPTVTCADASALENRSCLLNVKNALIKPSAKEDNVGKYLCGLSGKDDVESKYIVDSGGSHWLFRAKKGTVLMTYRLMDVCSTGRRL